MAIYHDSELGLVPVQDRTPLWPWALAAVLIGALSGLIALTVIVPHLTAVNEPTRTPLIEDHK